MRPLPIDSFLVCIYQTAAVGYRLDTQLSAPHRFMTLGSWTCKAGPPSRYRHVFSKLPNLRSFCLLTISIKNTAPSLRSTKPSNHFRKPRGKAFGNMWSGPVSTCKVHDFHVNSMILCWFTWLIVYCFLFVSFGHTQWLQSLHRTKKRTGDSACLCVCLVFVSFVFVEFAWFC